MPKYLALALLLSACGTSRVDDILKLEGDVTAGEALYTEHCAACHLADGRGTSGGGTGQDLTAGLPATQATSIEVILDGKEDMTAFGDVLSDQEVADVNAYMYDAFGQ